VRLAWSGIPNKEDPRIPFCLILSTYLVCGITVLGFNRTVPEILFTVLLTCALDMAMHFTLRERKLLVPLSSFISSLSLCILANYSHGSFAILVPIVLTVTSKYFITFNGSHVFNPTLFGLAISLLYANETISISPSSQWGGSISIAVFVATVGIILLFTKLNRKPLLISWLLFYTISLAARAYIKQNVISVETIFLGALAAPWFYLFSFFMITDPKTSPNTVKEQVLMGFAIAAIDFWLNINRVLTSVFFSGLIYFSVRFFILHLYALAKEPKVIVKKVRSILPKALVSFALIGGVFWGNEAKIGRITQKDIGFFFQEKLPEEMGFTLTPGNIIDQVDPAYQNVGKWFLSIGDAVAVSDVNNDGLQDVFLTNTMKHNNDRPLLLLNLGNFKFQRFQLPLEKLFKNPKQQGIPSGAVIFDFDNDDDQDIYIPAFYGKAKFLKNMLNETGSLSFVESSIELGTDNHSQSISDNVFDYDQDGFLDIMVANFKGPRYDSYEKDAPYLSIFSPPKPQYPGDNRMFMIMPSTWHNSQNGGDKWLLVNKKGQSFKFIPGTELGMEQGRWSTDIGFGDFNKDGYQDVYFSNDYGPDEFYLNLKGQGLKPVRGPMFGSIAKDTYKGMNVTIGDVNNDGHEDIYISNIHHRVLAEGSLLYINNGKVDSQNWRAFQNQAAQMNALNKRRFGWGAAMVDLNRDGRLDIVQVNGMVDDNYDKTHEKCTNYMYWLAKIGITPAKTQSFSHNWAHIKGRCIFPFERKRVLINQGNNFVDVAKKVGWRKKENARGVAMVDIDNDGDLDSIISHPTANASFYENISQKKSWIGLDLRGNGKSCNRDAIGTKVKLHYKKGPKELVQYREVKARNGLSSQGDRRLLFGLGHDNRDIRVEVNWCGNTSPKTFILTVNRYHQLKQ
jgi:hypothetical protein